jgi:peptidoglycan/xylan/chitin deacetylase (PgdA/CDA1 family)
VSDVLVLCYHAVSSRWRSALAVTPDAFEHQICRLVRRGYRGVTFTDAVMGETDGRVLAVTFDDAYRSVLEVAAPVLAHLGVPATVYVPTRWVGAGEPMRWPGIEEWSDGPFADELRCMDAGQLRALAEAGWEIGSHTVSHPRLTALDDDALYEELRTSRGVVEELVGRTCRSIAYPYGDVNLRVTTTAAAAGYVAGAVLPSRPHRPIPFAWPRVGVYPADEARWRFAVKASRVVRTVRARVRR